MRWVAGAYGLSFFSMSTYKTLVFFSALRAQWCFTLPLKPLHLAPQRCHIDVTFSAKRLLFMSATCSDGFQILLFLPFKGWHSCVLGQLNKLSCVLGQKFYTSAVLHTLQIAYVPVKEAQITAFYLGLWWAKYCHGVWSHFQTEVFSHLGLQGLNLVLEVTCLQ